MANGLFNKLVTQNSNLRLLKFGKDLPGAGTSRQPYVTKPLPGVEDPLPTNSPDFLLRQGTLQRIADDGTRFFKYFASTQGLAFIAKQNLLSLTSVRTQASQGPSNQGAYLPTNTSAQLAANPFGGHLNFLGVDPTGLLGGIRKYGDLVNPPLGIGNIAEVNNNRLVLLHQSKSNPNYSSVNPNTGISNNPNFILSYTGGPGASEGIGKTNIKRYVNTLELTDEGILKGTPGAFSNGTITYDQIQLQEQPTFRENGIGFIKEDFRKALRESNSFAKTVLPASPNYSGTDNKNWETRTNYSNSPGDPRKDIINSKFDPETGTISYVRGRGTALDKINALPIYQSIGSEGRTGRIDPKTKPINDLIKFRIAAIDNDNPEAVNYIHFRAFIDSFSDSYSGDWSGERYPGRGEEFFRYNGFSRQISLSFTSAAQSKQELIPMYKKLNYLASNTMNDYSPSGYMRPPFIKLTIGGYLYEQFGFIRSLNYDWEMKAPFEIGLNDTGGEDTSVKELPHVIRVTGFQFQPIYQFLPQKQSLTFDEKGNLVADGFEHYIALSAGDNDNYISGSNTI